MVETSPLRCSLQTWLGLLAKQLPTILSQYCHNTKYEYVLDMVCWKCTQNIWTYEQYDTKCIYLVASCIHCWWSGLVSLVPHTSPMKLKISSPLPEEPVEAGAVLCAVVTAPVWFFSVVWTAPSLDITSFVVSWVTGAQISMPSTVDTANVEIP